MVKELVSVTVVGIPATNAEKYKRKRVKVRNVFKEAYLATIPDDEKGYEFY